MPPRDASPEKKKALSPFLAPVAQPKKPEPKPEPPKPKPSLPKPSAKPQAPSIYTTKLKPVQQYTGPAARDRPNLGVTETFAPDLDHRKASGSAVGDVNHVTHVHHGSHGNSTNGSDQATTQRNGASGSTGSLNLPPVPGASPRPSPNGPLEEGSRRGQQALASGGASSSSPTAATTARSNSEKGTANGPNGSNKTGDTGGVRGQPVRKDRGAAVEAMVGKSSHSSAASSSGNITAPGQGTRHGAASLNMGKAVPAGKQRLVPPSLQLTDRAVHVYFLQELASMEIEVCLGISEGILNE